MTVRAKASWSSGGRHCRDIAAEKRYQAPFVLHNPPIQTSPCSRRSAKPPDLCLYCAYTTGHRWRTFGLTQGGVMQKGSLIRSSRRRGPDVWEYRWRESCPGDKRKHRGIVIGSLDTLRDESAALKAIVALRREININDARLRAK